MKKEKIDITHEENQHIENLFSKYNAYMNMLEYFANQRLDNSNIYEKKWEETSNIWMQLDKAKHEIEKKYKPAGDWDRYEFNFDNQQVVFIKE